MRKLLLTALVVGLPSSAFAAESGGCDKFKWPVDHARAALANPDGKGIASGATFAATPASAVTLQLRPKDEADLPMPPERAPKDGTFAGFIRITDGARAGSTMIALSAAAWVDVVQDGRALKPAGFSGVTDCEGIRKVMKFDLAAKPFVLQLSGLKDPRVIVSILPAD